MQVVLQQGKWRQTLNTIFITIGSILIAALTIILVGPLFVDWTEYKDTIEDYAEQALGQPVTVLGEIDVRLLPSPSLNFTDVRVGEAEKPLVTVSSMKVNLELPPLLRREIIFKELILEQPTLELVIDESGKFIWNFEESGVSQIAPDSVKFGEVRIDNGLIKVDDARSADTYSFGGINVVGSARSLFGPFQAKGTLRYAGEQYVVSMATGTWQQDVGMAVNAAVSTQTEQVSFELKGNLFHLEGTPEFQGDLLIASKASEDVGEDSVLKILNGSGKATISTNVVNVEDLGLWIGPEERAVGIQGQFVAELGATTNFKLNLNSKQVNLDRLLGKGPNKPVSAEIAAASVLDMLDNLPVTEQEGIVNLYMAGMVVNGSIIQEIGIQAIARPTGWRLNNVSAKFPGLTKVSSDGILHVNDTTAFQGKLEFESLQPSTYFKWLNEEAASEKLSLDPISFSMNLDVAGGKQSFSNINGMLGEEKFHGSVFMTSDSESSKNEVIADFNADLLEYEQIQMLADVFGLWNMQSDAFGIEKSQKDRVSVKLHAKEIDFGTTKAALVSVDLMHEGDKFEILNFQTSDWAGVRVAASGSVSGMESSLAGVLKMNLSSSDLTESIGILGKYFPENQLVGQLAERSDLFSPMTLDTHLTIEPFADNRKAVMNVKGALDETDFNANFTMIGKAFNLEENDLESSITANADEGLDLLRQLGLDLLETAEFGNTKLIAKLNGRTHQDLNVSLSYLAKDLELTANGTAGNFGSRNLTYDLEVNMWSPDINNLAIVTGHLPPLADNRAPIDLSAEVKGTGGAFRASKISGKYAGTEFSGGINRSVSQDRQQIKGNLNLSELELQSLGELILGPDAWNPTGSGSSLSYAKTLQSRSNWSNAGFEDPILKDGGIILDIATDKFLLSPDRPLNNASFRLTLKPDELALEDFKVDFFGGEMLGNLIVRQSAGEAGLSGTMVMKDAGLDGFFQSQNGQPLASGKLNLFANFESTGRSVAGLVKGLNGGGTFSIEDGEYSKLNMEAFELMASDAYSAADINISDVYMRFSEYLDNGSFKFEKTEGNILISAGQISTRNVGTVSDTAEIIADGTFDMNEWEVESDWSITSNYTDEISQSKPKVDLKFKGAVGNVGRTIDVSKLATYLTIRAFDIENQRNGALNDAEALARQEAVQEIKELHEEDEVQTDERRLTQTDGSFQEITGGELEPQLETEPQKEVEQQQSIQEKKKPLQDLETQDVSKPSVKAEFPSNKGASPETDQPDVVDSKQGTEKLNDVSSQDEPKSGQALKIQEEQNLLQESEPIQDNSEITPRGKPVNSRTGKTANQNEGSDEKENLGEFIDGLEKEDVPPTVQPSNEADSTTNEEIQEEKGTGFEEKVRNFFDSDGNGDTEEVETNSADFGNSASNSIIRENLKPLGSSGN